MSFLSIFGINRNKGGNTNNTSTSTNKQKRLSTRRSRSDSLAALENLVPMFKEKSEEYKSLSSDQDVHTEQDKLAPPGKKAFPVKFINVALPQESWRKGTLELSDLGVIVMDEKGVTEAIYQYSLIRNVRNTGLSVEFNWRESPGSAERLNAFQCDKPIDVYDHFISWIQHIVAVRKSSGK